MSKKWYHQLRDAKFKEFSFFPNAYTPMEEDRSISLPPVELEFDGGEEKEEGSSESSIPEWVKNVSFTIAGVTIGGAAVYSLFATTPPPSCPAPVNTTEQAVQSPLPSSSHTPTSNTSGGTSPRTTGTPAGATTTNSSAGSAGNATSTSSSDGTL